MSEIAQKPMSLLGKTLGRVITADEIAQVSGGRWWRTTEQTIHNDAGPIVIEEDPVEIWVY